MSRSVITINPLSEFNSGVAISKDVIDSASGHTMDISGYPDQDIQVFMEVNDDPLIFTVNAGDFERSVLGDLDILVGADELQVVTLESSRFNTVSGMIDIDIASGVGTGNIFATGGL